MSLEDLIADMESIVSQMVTVVDGELVLAKHTNLFVDFITDAVEVAKKLYEEFKTKTGKTLPDVETWLAMAEGRLKFAEKRKFGDLVLTKDHNVIVDIMKPLELALKKIEEELET